MTERALKDRLIVVKGAGEMATGVACRLYRANFRRILMLETPNPMAVRRRVCFSEAVYDKSITVEGIEAVKVSDEAALSAAWAAGKIAIRVDPQAQSVGQNRPDVFIDATLAKRNLGIKITDAPLVIALGPGFVAGEDAHIIIETNRGHNLGRTISAGPAEANTGDPGNIGGYTTERVLRAPADGAFITERQLGDCVNEGDEIGQVGGVAVNTVLGGVLRGLIRPGITVSEGQKIGDVDPRGDVSYCNSISEKARAIGGAVLEAILARYNR
ncbi:MAG: selenium-dependent molybdenum cofactor biosynthesis protein YqeB [Desulfuromonadales bacterium]|nr:selenium-dependent molybdenum cofactor biosynthesis protein YqeB [Desulfuromonadales bacterium]